MNLDEFPLMEFAFPGPLRDRLVTAIFRLVHVGKTP